METKNCLDELLEVMMAQRCDDHSTDHPASQETAVEAGNSTSATRKAASHLDTLALAMLCKPLSSLDFIPALMTCYVAFRSQPSVEVQIVVSQHLRGSCEIRPSMYNISQPKAQKPQRHQVTPTSLSAIASLTPTLTFQTAKTAAAARAKCTHLWRSIGVLAALHVDVLSPDQVSEILLWSTESGFYDKELFEVVSGRIRDKEDGLSTAFMSRLKDSSLISMLRAIASARHQDKAVIEALVSEAAFRLGSKVDHSRHLSSNMSGRVFSLIDLSYLVTSLAVVGHQDAQLLTVASREAFGQLLQLVDKQELEDERTRDEHVQAGQAPPSHTEPGVDSVEILVSLAWGLHAAGRSCQPVLLDALALLLPVPRSLQGLDLGGLLKLLEVCTAVTKAAMCEAGDASKAAGAKQLVGSVAEVLSERVEGLSVHQAARVGTLMASVQHYNEPLMRSICSFPAVAWSAAGWQCKDAWTLPMPWGCLAELAAAAASLRYDPTTILGNVDAYAEALRSSLQMHLHGSSAHLLPSPSVLCKLAYASATLSRTDHHLLALVREVALQPESQASLSVRQLCELTWALAVSEHHLWKQRSVEVPQKKAAARVQSHKQQSSWVLKDVRKQKGLSAAWLDNVGGAGDDNGRSSQEAKAIAAVLSIFSLAMSQLSDVREPYVLQMCEAYLSLLSSLRGEHYQQLLSFPVQWRNTLQYAWEQQLKARKRVKQKVGSSLFTQMLAVGPVYADLEDDVETDSIGPLQMMEERKKLLTVLQSLGFRGALTDRMIKVGGFLVDADVTLETGSGQAVVVLLDSSQSYIRTESLPANANGHIQKEERQAASLRLMGQAAWRERLLGRAGWLVARIHWHDWRTASSTSSSKACENLVKMVLGTLLEE
ncbi:hypothetical protein CEUSTIGMA_g12158.t1 [Chlamydomonas eustigma]|uniref:RAP domain-containing protein n=1 Tax=Chlamydomonas eustigma TaxID=1157962 RepID=A0A250XNY0_9CHLO|nr:hypothetical protein CEUSTIGMA_g12158.t1 [Chlamydomonas eustigma]|eukprot:GAX84736.1 hypothetical protein CEUSTIGMA_g12158.t1 [Chlamydomonas eustigma]